MLYPIVVLYHRSPPDFQNRKDTIVNWKKNQSPNGIIPYLLDVMTSFSKNSCWISATTEVTKATDSLYNINEGHFCSSRLYIDSKDYSLFYDVYSKQYLWPLLHQYPEHLIELPSGAATSFIEVNNSFAQAACDKTAIGGTVWIHDYNLWLAPLFIKKQRPDIKISLFFHTAFPKKRYLKSLKNEDLFRQSLLACDILGFHIPRFVNLCAEWLQDYLNEKSIKSDQLITYHPADHKVVNPSSALSDDQVASELKTNGSKVKFVAKPLPVKYVNSSRNNNGELSKNKYEDLKIYENRNLSWYIDCASKINYSDTIRIIFSARCDYTKGGVELLQALKVLILKIPETAKWIHVDFISVPSAVYNPVYKKVEQEISSLCNSINVIAKRRIINFIDHCLPQKELYSLLEETDICCVPSTYDGLNMVAKEFIALRKKDTGRLVLSKYTGASVELDGAILVDPFDTEDLLRGILLAIIDNPKASRQSMNKMKEKLNSVSDKWSTHFLTFQ